MTESAEFLAFVRQELPAVTDQRRARRAADRRRALKAARADG
ncbi:hypothetical protein [Streptomyces genisteinicus]|nr:hypothetical protein [Streptomyces genisteinicus]